MDDPEEELIAAWHDAALAAELAKRLTAVATEAARHYGGTMPATVTTMAEDTLRAAEGTAESARGVADA